MSGYYNIHTHQTSHDPGITSIRSFAVDDLQINTDSYFSIGIHPWFITDMNHQLEKLKSFLNHSKLVALGECGLDLLKGPDIEIQKEVFISHIELSEKFQWPLVIHCVKAHHLLLEIKKELNPEQPWIVHGFNGKPELAMQLTQHNISISLGISWLKKQNRFKELMHKIPDRHLFFETDEAPAADIIKLYSLCGNNKPDIREIIRQNVKNIFNI